jgi:hypothetical protein
MLLAVLAPALLAPRPMLLTTPSAAVTRAVATFRQPLRANHGAAPVPPCGFRRAGAPRMCAAAAPGIPAAPLAVRGASAAAFVLAAASAGRPGLAVWLGALLVAALAPSAALVTSVLMLTGAANYYPTNFIAMSSGESAQPKPPRATPSARFCPLCRHGDRDPAYPAPLLQHSLTSPLAGMATAVRMLYRPQVPSPRPLLHTTTPSTSDPLQVLCGVGCL